MKNMLFIFFIITIIVLIIISWLIYKTYKEKKEIREKIERLANNTFEITPEEFMKLRNKSFGGKGKPLYSNKYNFSGVYILYNITKDLYYIGQGQKVLNRVNSHFTGRGNGDVYADYKYGDEWTIKMIALENSGFYNLNDLERNFIKIYNSFEKGYNKTRGNK